MTNLCRAAIINLYNSDKLTLFFYNDYYLRNRQQHLNLTSVLFSHHPQQQKQQEKAINNTDNNSTQLRLILATHIVAPNCPDLG